MVTFVLSTNKSENKEKEIVNNNTTNNKILPYRN